MGPIQHIIADHGEGVYLYDVEGRCYLDFTSGIGVANTGHAHPHQVQEALAIFADALDEME